MSYEPHALTRKTAAQLAEVLNRVTNLSRYFAILSTLAHQEQCTGPAADVRWRLEILAKSLESASLMVLEGHGSALRPDRKLGFVCTPGRAATGGKSCESFLPETAPEVTDMPLREPRTAGDFDTREPQVHEKNRAGRTLSPLWEGRI